MSTGRLDSGNGGIVGERSLAFISRRYPLPDLITKKLHEEDAAFWGSESKLKRKSSSDMDTGITKDIEDVLRRSDFKNGHLIRYKCNTDSY